MHALFYFDTIFQRLRFLSGFLLQWSYWIKVPICYIESALRKFYGSRNDFASCYRIFVSQIAKDICSCSRDNTVILSSSMTDCLLFATRVTGRVQHVEKELSTLPKHKNVTSRHNIAKDW